MSAIYINGEPVVQSNFPEMTLAQYNALPEAEKPEFWVRTDASYDSIPGTDVTFNNKDTDIESTDVDGAIKEVDAKTQHGLYELWKGSSVSTFAGQTITINNIDVSKIDAFFIEIILLANEVLPSILFCIDKDVSSSTKYLRWVDTGGKLQRYQRPFTMTYTDNSVSFTFQDTTFYEWATYGASSPTTQTSNGNLIPYRILGLIHND